MIWQIFGRNTSRPWDKTAAEPAEKNTQCEAGQLSEDERLTFVEWIDLGALWDGIPGPDNLPGKTSKFAGEKE